MSSADDSSNFRLPQRKALPHAPPFWVRAEAEYFVTICCQPRGRDQLCHPGIAGQIFETVFFRQERGDWWVNLLVLMPDHLHLLVAFPGDAAMRQVVADWKRFLARQAGLRWQRDFFDHRLRSDESREEKVNYLLENPVRAGLVERAEDWPYVWRPGDAPSPPPRR